ncbi:MAG: alpha-glucosidase/alpha-galactosidase, partial [Lentisphaerae bacterium]|nr:alpha-glucosidase/alpha-galactosidase [Lentisphaerota bacterium]
MPKIAFMGAGSTVFAKNVLGDSLMTPSLQGATIALYDVDPGRLQDSKLMLDNLKGNLEAGAVIEAYCGCDQRQDALRGADYVVNAIQVGGYEPSTVIDFEIPKKYGLRQTIADTLGIGGIFRSLRTIPVVLDFARDMADVCPDAWFLNYVNPMAMITGALLRGSGISAVGLCHSVQVCAPHLLKHLGIEAENLSWEVAGINHQAWLLSVMDGDKDLYPEIKKLAAEKNAAGKHGDMVR